MTRRKSVKNKKGNFMAKVIAGGLCACILAAVVGFASTNMLSADEVSVGLGSSGSFSGKISVSSDITPPAASTAAASNASSTSSAATPAGQAAQAVDEPTVFDQAINGRTALNDLAPCNITTGLKTLSDRIEEARRVAEEEQRAAEQAHIQEVQAKQRAYGGESAVQQVDFSVGEQAFVEEWTQRIDAYLAGSNLAGHGCDFAQAAWDYGVDPRWSPAISNTESGKGAHCFLPHNAWGWGASIWFNWTDAIYDHVKGLADGYGYSITYAAASKYCPPNTDNWYRNTSSEMAKI